MKPGDIVQTFGNPVKCETPIGMARLIRKLNEQGTLLENWQVEYLNDEGHYYNCLIKKTDGENKLSNENNIR